MANDAWLQNLNATTHFWLNSVEICASIPSGEPLTLRLVATLTDHGAVLQNHLGRMSGAGPTVD